MRLFCSFLLAALTLAAEPADWIWSARRPLEMTLGTPQGPVYLTLPREVLAQKMDSITIHPYRKAKVEALQPSAETIRRTAESFVRRRISRYTGGWLRSHRGSDGLFAEALVAPVSPRKPLREFPNTHDFI
jgi:thiamine pyrophosphate-dependent acetolactate synthase large subunit-like protein